MSNRRLAIYLVMQLAVTTTCIAAECKFEMLKTPAVYVEHLGDSDKPIFPIVIGTKRPSVQEFRCAVPSLLSVEVFVVTEEELAQTIKILKQYSPSGDSTTDLREGRGGGEQRFRYVVVPKLGTRASGILDLAESHDFFAALAAYFDGRRPRLHDHLTVTIRRF